MNSKNHHSHGKRWYSSMSIALIAIIAVGTETSSTHGFTSLTKQTIKKYTFESTQLVGATIQGRDSTSSSLFYSSRNDDSSSSSSFDMDVLRERIQNLKVNIMEEELQRPPNPSLKAEELIAGVLDGLLHPYDPLPDSGYRLLLRASTKQWRSAILQSIGANNDADLDTVASALGTAIGRPHNQFAILVGEGEDFILDFSDPVDFYDDDKCWVECRLRAKEDGKLLVITGWSLRRRDDGAWLVDSMEWQDFRDEFRPGIGREEWMRICG